MDLEKIRIEQCDNGIRLVKGDYSAEFVQKDQGWYPDWFYLNNRKVLRFKDHEWLSIGHIRSAAKEYTVVEEPGRKGVEFTGIADYEGVAVDWSVCIAALYDEEFFQITSTIRPSQNIELLEAFSAMETPYEYSGLEDALCMIGQNPITHWKDGKAIAQERYELPQWVLTRKDSARSIIRSKNPVLCFRVFEKPGDSPLYVSFVGNWIKCSFHSLFMTPTGFTRGKRGFKFIVGAHNWSSAIVKDPNVLFEKGAEYVQDFYFQVVRNIVSTDAWYHEAFLKGVRLHFPTDGNVTAFERAKERKATLKEGCEWLLKTFNSNGLPGLYEPERGIITYIAGTRPKTGDWGKNWLAQLIGPISYHFLITGNEEYNVFCKRHKKDIMEMVKSNARYLGIVTLNSIYYCLLQGDDEMIETCRTAANQVMARMAPKKGLGEIGDPGELYRNGADNGVFSILVEGLLVIYRMLNNPEYLEASLNVLERINADLDHRFWFFGNCGQSRDTQSGGQIRPHGLGHAVKANTLAYEITKEGKYLDAAERCAKYLVSICYSVYSDSPDPDFDYRGFANGAIAGRDLTAEYPPWETADSLLCAAYLMKYRKVDGVLYMLWYLQRTYQGAFPAAREYKKFYDSREMPLVRKTAEVASEKNIYLRYPFLAYECPYDQTLQASYQGVDPLLCFLAFAGGLVRAEDERLLVLVPEAAGFNEKIKNERYVLLFNPLDREIKTELMFFHMNRSGGYEVCRKTDKKTFRLECLEGFTVEVPAKGTLELTVKAVKPIV